MCHVFELCIFYLLQLRVDGEPTLVNGKLQTLVLGANVPLELTLSFLTSGAVRALLTEKGLPPRWQVLCRTQLGCLQL